MHIHAGLHGALIGSVLNQLFLRGQLLLVEVGIQVDADLGSVAQVVLGSRVLLLLGNPRLSFVLRADWLLHVWLEVSPDGGVVVRSVPHRAVVRIKVTPKSRLRLADGAKWLLLVHVCSLQVAHETRGGAPCVELIHFQLLAQGLVDVCLLGCLL